MATRAQVSELLDAGHTYETAARELDIPAGQAFMIVTGMPADGSDGVAPRELHGGPGREKSSQHLVNPPPFNPTRDASVLGWVKGRATRELHRS